MWIIDSGFKNLLVGLGLVWWFVCCTGKLNFLTKNYVLDFERFELNKERDLLKRNLGQKNKCKAGLWREQIVANAEKSFHEK